MQRAIFERPGLAILRFLVLAAVAAGAPAAAAPGGETAVDWTSEARIERLFAAGDLALTGAGQDEAATAPPEAPDQTTDAKGPLRFGARNTWRFHVQAGGAVDFSGGEEPFAMGGVAFSYFVVDDVSLDIELNGMYFKQPDGDAFGANLAILLRWHFYTDVNWSLYADAGAGILGTTSDVPSDGTSFNFTPQAGAGVSFDVAANVRMLVGVRWHHISNGSLSSSNPGRDSVLGYAALSWPF